jgi:hypothetical protein
MWRNENSGSFFLLFNAMLNYRHLDVGRTALEAKSNAGKK